MLGHKHFFLNYGLKMKIFKVMSICVNSGNLRTLGQRAKVLENKKRGLECKM